MTSTLNNISLMLAPLVTVSEGAFKAIQIALFVCMVVCAVFTIVIVMFQPGNSAGMGAMTGETDTFFGNNKTNSIEGKMKRLTIVALCVIIVFSVLFFIVTSGILIGAAA